MSADSTGLNGGAGRTGTPAGEFWISGDSRMTRGVNGVDQLRLDVVSRLADGCRLVECLLSYPP